MARLARKDLADLRAVEEEESRVSMHGGGRFIGAGRRGSSSDEDCCMCGGARRGGAPFTVRPGVANPSSYTYAIRPVAPLRPVGPAPVRPVAPTKGPAVPPVFKPLPPSNKPLPPKPLPPSNIKPIGTGPTGPTGPGRLLPRIPPKGPARNALIAKLAAAGLSAAAIAAILAGSLGAFGPVGSQDEEGDQGYYDDYTGEAGVDQGGPYAPGGDAGPGGPGGMYENVYGPGGPGGLVPTNLSPSEVAFYLQSGNLPDRFYSGPRSKRGGFLMNLPGLEQKFTAAEERQIREYLERNPIRVSDSRIMRTASFKRMVLARIKSDGDKREQARSLNFSNSPRGVALPVAQVGGGRRSDRAAIVKQVMADQGISMIEASRYVKANNLY